MRMRKRRLQSLLRPTGGMAGVWLSAAVLLLAASAVQAQVRVDVEAYAGTPFGVGRITLNSGGGEIRIGRVPRPGGGRIADLTRRVINQAGKGDTTSLESAELAVTEKSGRVLYPVFEKRDRPILRQFVNVPSASTILFLFEGDAPLELTVHAPQPYPGQVVPRQDRDAHDRLLAAWWRDYSSAAEGRDVVREYPPMVEEYLTDTLARRLNLPLARRSDRAESGLLAGELNQLFETETARLDWAQSILLGRVEREPASEVLPEELPAPKPELLNPPPADTPFEPIAARVPVECFYVRFGSFPNFLWLRHRLDEWGGEVRDLVSQRGLDFGLSDRFERQLGLRESALAEVLGERVIADVAIIGADTFFSEGPAIAMLFQAKSNTALTADLTQQRLAALKESSGGKQETLTIAGRPVSLVSTPDNALRSFYVTDGDFHLVSTSRALVEWFLATGTGKHDSLAGSDEFRYTRARVPLAENDTIFAYLSPQFFQNLLSPRYQIELNRRLRSAVEMELLPIARLAARAEKKPGDTLEQLVAGGLLPGDFGSRPDGTRLELVEGKLVDSMRGGRGTFLPVADVNLDKVTPSEARRYQGFSQSYQDFGAMDPIVARVRREPVGGGKLERVIVDLQVAPLSQRHADLLAQWLGEPTDQRLAPVAGNAVSFEAVMRGGTYFPGGEHHLFGALRDADPAIALDARSGLIARLVTSQFEGLQGYLGAWPNPGLLRLMSGILETPVDEAGYSRLATGLWRRQFDDFMLLSFHREILQKASGQLRFEKAPRPAQIWLHADDLAQSQLAGFINAYGYRQTRQATAGNTRFLNMLSEQLHVPPAECLATAEQLLAARFVSPLGGKYELREFGGGLKTWVATALADRPDNSSPPADYQFPALAWLRGLDVEVSAREGALTAHVEALMPVETRPAAFQLPSLPFGAGKTLAKPQPTDSGKGAAGATKSAPRRPALPGPSGARPSGKREF